MKTIEVQSMVDLLNVDHTTLDAGDRIRTMSYHPPVFPSTHFHGGRAYIWTPTRPKVDHDGGTYISLTCPWDGTHAGLPDFLNHVGDLDPCSNGCLVLEDPWRVYVEDYGALGNGTDDDWDAINAAIGRELIEVDANHTVSGHVLMRDTTYSVSKTFNVKTEVRWEGLQRNATLKFPESTAGIIVNRDDTIDDTIVDPPTGDGGGSVLANFTVDGNYGSDTTKHGIWMRRGCVLEHMVVSRFAGNGVNIVASAVTEDNSRLGNANNWVMYNVICTKNKGHGVYVAGADVNGGIGMAVDCTTNEGAGIVDDSFLGNVWVGCHVATNDLGCYEANGENSHSVFVGCYSEGGRPESVMVGSNVMIGGLQGAGITGPWMHGELVRVRDVIASRQLICEESGGAAVDHVVARNMSSLSSSFEAQFSGYSGVLADESAFRPAGTIFMRPTSGSPENPTVLGFKTYSGETANEMVEVAYFWGNTDFSPSTDNTTDLGYSANQWKDIYLANSPTVSSDAQLKQDVADLTTAEYAVAVRLRGLVKTYRMKSAVAKKGAGARKHVGIIAQDVIQAFEDEGLDAGDYGIVCRGPGAKNVGERFSVRYEELLAFMIAAL